ncbi:hypothetical protein C8R43DRAFT_1125977 [Mycena crocata]|nr:hypothetical protein C8R43DRAFT_1125977 [Mycena crocata]
MPEIPWTSPPFSQKRTTKSIERTAVWLGHLLAPCPPPPNVLVHKAGGTSEPARRAIADSLIETTWQGGRAASQDRPIRTQAWVRVIKALLLTSWARNYVLLALLPFMDLVIGPQPRWWKYCGSAVCPRRPLRR